MIAVTISLPEALKAFIDAQLRSKGGGDVSEYVQALVCEAQARDEEARFEALLLEGLSSERVPLDSHFRQGLAAEVETVLSHYGAVASP